MPKLVMRHENEHLYATPPTSAEGQRLSAALLRLREAERVQAQRTLTRAGLSHLDLSALRYLVQGYRD
uniref:hypothetical protein n=1 Tax=Campylobacter coli TaxID=195 RepID=UPI003CE8656F